MFRERKVVTVTDSTCDIPPDLAREHGITIVSLEVRFDTRRGEIYKDGVDMTSADFFDKLRTSKVHPGTSAPPVGEFEETYIEIMERTRSIFSIHLFDDYSGTLKIAQMAAKKVIEDDTSHNKPDIRVKDSGQVSLGLGIAALRAAKLAERRKKLPEIEEEINALLPRIYTFCVLPTLEYARKGGRLSNVDNLASYIPSFLHKVPLLRIYDGRIRRIKFIKDNDKVNGLITYVKEFAKGNEIKFEEMAIIHGKALAEAQSIQDTLKDMTDYNLGIFELGPALGVHSGPGTVAVSVLLSEKT